VAVTIIYYMFTGAGWRPLSRRHYDGGGLPAFRRGRVPGGAGGQLEPALSGLTLSALVLSRW